MPELPDRHFDTWTISEVATACEDEPVDVMPGSGRRVPGPRRKLLEAMQADGVVLAGDLPPDLRSRHFFSLVGRPEASRRVCG